MELEELLLIDQSRINADHAVEIITQKPELFDTLWSLYLKNEEPVSRRAAWVMDILTDRMPLLKESQLDLMINHLYEFKHDGLKRHTLKIIERNNITEKQMGQLMLICFQWLESPYESAAVKVFCLKILDKIALREPQISRELIDIIDMQIPEASPSFKSIGKKVLKKLQKISANLQSQ